MPALRLFVVFFCATLALRAGDTPRKLAFERDGAVYVANLDGTAEKKIAEGACPNPSPDGAHLAFNTETANSPKRHIAIADLATGKVKIVEGIPSDNCYGPLWSPDGATIIFHAMKDKDWQLGLIDANGEHFRYFEPKAPVGSAGLNSVAWTPDSQSFYAQDLDSLYHFALDGTLKDKRDATKLVPRGSFSSAQQFTVLPDGHTLLLDADMDEKVTRKDWDGPPPAIWTVDLTSGKATRITPKGLFAWMPCRVSESEIICSAQPDKAKQPSIYRLSMDGKKRVLIVKNANFPSVSH
jgi:TolB protein